MNRYIDNNAGFSSNLRNYPSRQRRASALALLLSVLFSILANKRLMGVVRALFTVCVLVGFIGIIGAMDAGTLGLGTGVALGLLLLGAEYLCLRRYA